MRKHYLFIGGLADRCTLSVPESSATWAVTTQPRVEHKIVEYSPATCFTIKQDRYRREVVNFAGWETHVFILDGMSTFAALERIFNAYCNTPIARQ